MRSLLIILGALSSAARASAQDAAAAYRLVGRVSASDGHAVTGAEVAIVNRDSVVRFTRSDSIGHFAFDGLTVPALTLRVRHVGFEPQILSVTITKAGRTASIAVTLEPSIASLDPVLVEDSAKRPQPNPRLIGFNDRRTNNSFGHYITEEMLAEQRPAHASEALRGVAGITLRPGARQGNLVRIRGCGARGGASERVGPLVWLDGVRLPGAEIDDVVQAADIAGIEVYNSFAGIPSQFFDRTAVCGTIVVWTKHR